MESDIFYAYSKNEFKIVENFFIEQYLLNMNYDPIMGYVYSANQQFNINREINNSHYQINNYSNVGINLYKIYNLLNKLKLEDKLPKKNIIYFGINEAYDISNNRTLFYSMRDQRIKNSIKNFENYYRNIPHDMAKKYFSSNARYKKFFW